jgi:hypothetical protein
MQAPYMRKWRERGRVGLRLGCKMRTSLLLELKKPSRTACRTIAPHFAPFDRHG